jgi:hypothetical protein
MIRQLLSMSSRFPAIIAFRSMRPWESRTAAPKEVGLGMDSQGRMDRIIMVTASG